MMDQDNPSHSGKYDVFLCYNRADNAARDAESGLITRISEELQEQGIRAWIDDGKMAFGSNMLGHVAVVLRETKRCAVLFLGGRLGEHQKEEMEHLLDPKMTITCLVDGFERYEDLPAICDLFRTHLSCDFRSNEGTPYRQALGELVRGVEEKLGSCVHQQIVGAQTSPTGRALLVLSESVKSRVRRLSEQQWEELLLNLPFQNVSKWKTLEDEGRVEMLSKHGPQRKFDQKDIELILDSVDNGPSPGGVIASTADRRCFFSEIRSIITEYEKMPCDHCHI